MSPLMARLMAQVEAQVKAPVKVLVLALTLTLASGIEARAQDAPPPGNPPPGAPPADADAAARAKARADWEAGKSGAKPPSPPSVQGQPSGQTPPSGQGEVRPRIDAARASGGKPPLPVSGDDSGVPFAAPVSPAAKAFAAKAREVLTLELQVQEFEARTLGREDPETLSGFRKARRLRVEEDKFFRSLKGQFSIKPLALPDPNLAPEASPEALAFFAALLRTYDATREVRLLEQMHELNQSFLKSQDWADRDRAVTIRDELMDRGVMFNTLAQRAWDIRHGTLGDDAIPELLAALHAEVPEPEAQASDLALLVLHNPELRTHVMTELLSLLSKPLAPPEPLPPAEELTGKVIELQAQLFEAAGLTEAMAQEAKLAAELENVNAALEQEPSRSALDKKVKITAKREEIQAQWFATEPDPALYEELATTQEILIRRRMLDLGTPGALFGPRYDATVAAREKAEPTAWARWSLLQEQRDLLQALDAAKPARTPLDDVVPPPLYGLGLLEKAKAEQAAKEEKKAKLFGKGKGLGAFSGKSAPKPKQHPKPKPGAGGKQGGKPGGKPGPYGKPGGQYGYGPKG
jgi:hypothetical protein